MHRPQNKCYGTKHGVSDESPDENLVIIASYGDYLYTKLMIFLFEGRNIYQNNELPFMPYLRVYKVSNFNIYTNRFMKIFSWLHNFGIAQYLNDILSFAIIGGHHLKEAVHNVNKNIPINFYTYMRQCVEKDYRLARYVIQQNIQHTKVATFDAFSYNMEIKSVAIDDLMAVWQLMVLAVLVSLSTLLGEKIKSYCISTAIIQLMGFKKSSCVTTF